jgi:hypothetical protein
LVLVRFLLFLALAAIVVAVVLYLFTKDRRYLAFIGRVIRYTVMLLAGVLIFYALERLVLFA